MNDEAMIAVRNCPPDFRFLCPKNWEKLETTEQEGIRFCSDCKEQVYLCQTDEEMIAHAKAGHCVAKFLPADRSPEINFVGRPKEPLVVDRVYSREMSKSLSLRWIEFSKADCPTCGFPMVDNLYGQIICLMCCDIPGIIDMPD